MTTPRSYSFDNQLAMSTAPSSDGDVATILIEHIPQAVHARPAHNSNDRRGTDWWVEMSNGQHLAIDVKTRAEDYLRKFGQDDIALETWSVKELRKAGWTLDQTKRTDYVLFLWLDTGRWALIPFVYLQGVFRKHQGEWTQKYQVARQHTPEFGGYHSECVFVPRREIWAAIYRLYGGSPQGALFQEAV